MAGTGIATSTLETFLGTTFGLGVNSALYLFGEIWPYLITIGVIVVFWRVGRAFFKG